MNTEMKENTMDNTPWSPSRQTLESILSERRYTPGEFVEALGSPTFKALLKNIQPMALWGLKALMKMHMCARVPRLNRRFAKECGRGRNRLQQILVRLLAFGRTRAFYPHL